MSEMKQQGLGVADSRPVDAIEDYQFEPIKGYPLLQWQGKRPFRSTRYYPAQLKEVHGPEVDGWRNKIYWGDNLQVMSHLLKQYRGQVQLVYIDPPFDSNAEYKKTIKFKNAKYSNDQTAFEEKQYTDIWTNDAYLQFMYARLILIRELLQDDGSLWLHCDYRKAHHLRCVLDEVFGPEQIVNEVVWKSTSFTGSSKTIANKFPVNHNTIYWYCKQRYVYNKQRNPYSEEYLERFKNPDNDPQGAWQSVALKTYSTETFERLKAEGALISAQSEGAGWRYKFYLKNAKGRVVETLWTDINMANSMAGDRTDYPTQKPAELLHRIIEASSNPGDLVFDCFMGSGTTQAVAMKLGRRFIGADINLGAVQITTKRLLQVAVDLEAKQTEAGKPKQAPIAYTADVDMEDGDEEDGAPAAAALEPTTLYTGFEVYNVNYYDVFRNPIQAKELLMQALEVQPLTAGSVFDGTKDGRMVKVMPVNRIATRADLNELTSNIDQKAFERLYHEHPHRVVERITLICMGHEPDLAASLKQELHPYNVDVEVVDVLRDRQDLQFKRDSEARVTVHDGWLVIEAFYPMNLLQKLSMQKENVADWRELVESVMIDWNYDGAVLTPATTDIPDKNELVVGHYHVPEGAGTIRVKLTDLLSESWEGNVTYG